MNLSTGKVKKETLVKLETLFSLAEIIPIL